MLFTLTFIRETTEYKERSTKTENETEKNKQPNELHRAHRGRSRKRTKK